MKKHSYLLGAAIISLAFIPCKSATPPSDNNLESNTPVAISNLLSTADNTQSIGIAKFYQAGNTQIRLELTIDDKSRANENVAVHFHEHGDCGDSGNNAHGHWNPTKENHGEWGKPPFHSGDIGNIKLDANGHGTKSITTDRWSVNEDTTKRIISLSIIVHGGTDDYTTQPTGNSGPRIGCGVIVKP